MNFPGVSNNDITTCYRQSQQYKTIVVQEVNSKLHFDDVAFLFLNNNVTK